jgi:phosphopantothenoylcysteine decarboxylase/phosphopantothenate--cysteine ligase
VLASYALGLSDTLLVATLLASRAPVIVCPAMHTEMWEQPAVQANVALLRERGVTVVGPVSGQLAGGDTGVGRLAEPADIVAACDAVLGGTGGSGGDLTGLRVLVTAGGTREAIDPVRYVGNRSSGKQGYAVAEEAASRGAVVTLVSTVHLPVSSGIEVIAVESAAEMQAAVSSSAPTAEIVVMAAAVADFRPKVRADDKLKKADGPPEVVLEPTPDILAGLGAVKPDGQTLVGFAAETQDLVAQASNKLRSKNLDLIVANDVSAPGAGFEHDTNAVVLLRADGSREDVPLTDKRSVARAVIDTVVTIRKGQP